MPIVYVTNEQSGKNILPAKKYGEIKILLPIDFQASFSAGRIAQELMVRLSNYRPEDYLLLIGDPIVIGIATAVASSWSSGKVSMLKWDRQTQNYIPVRFNLYSQKGESDEKESFE